MWPWAEIHLQISSKHSLFAPEFRRVLLTICYRETVTNTITFTTRRHRPLLVRYAPFPNEASVEDWEMPAYVLEHAVETQSANTRTVSNFSN